MKRWWLLVMLLGLALFAAWSATLFVQPTEYVFITRFGSPVATYDGATDAGLRFKWPWPVETALRLDRRVDLLEVPTQEFLIRDTDEATKTEKPLPLTFDLFVCWRIGTADGKAEAAAVDKFVRSFGSVERARAYLRAQVISRLKIELGGIAFSELVNTNPKELHLQELLRRIRTQPFRTETGPGSGRSLEQRADDVGIAILDVGLRRFNHPSQVRGEIIAKIREDRKREASTYLLQGEEQAARIRAEGDLEAKRIRAAAEAERIRLEGQAEADATRILNAAHQQDPQLFELVRLLRSYPKMFGDDKTQLLLSLDHPLLRLFKEVPGLKEMEKKPAGKPAANATGTKP